MVTSSLLDFSSFWGVQGYLNTGAALRLHSGSLSADLLFKGLIEVAGRQSRATTLREDGGGRRQAPSSSSSSFSITTTNTSSSSISSYSSSSSHSGSSSSSSSSRSTTSSSRSGNDNNFGLSIHDFHPKSVTKVAKAKGLFDNKMFLHSSESSSSNNNSNNKLLSQPGMKSVRGSDNEKKEAAATTALLVPLSLAFFEPAWCQPVCICGTSVVV
jgi:hypothetical protein